MDSRGHDRFQFDANIYLQCIWVVPPYYLYNLLADGRCIFSRFNNIFQALLFISNGYFGQTRNIEYLA